MWVTYALLGEYEVQPAQIGRPLRNDRSFLPGGLFQYQEEEKAS